VRTDEDAAPMTSTFKQGPAALRATSSLSSTAAAAAAVSGRLVSGYTSLHWAVENDDGDAVALLLSAGADVNRAAAFDAHAGVTPLHLAAQDGHTEVAAALLRHGAERDPRKSTRHRDNVTPLHQAVYNGHAATVGVLLAAGCDPGVQADNGYAALHYAAQRGDVAMTRAIVGAPGCDAALRASTRDQRDITALHLAVQSASVDVVRALAAAGAPVDAGKRMADGVAGVTPLHQAVYQERDEIVAALLELGADARQSMDGWYTPLHVAAEKGSAAIARRLLEAMRPVAGEVEAAPQGGVDARASHGEHVDVTPLHVAAQHGHADLIRLLLDAGADTAAVRGFGDRGAITALHLAAENGFVDAVAALLESTHVEARDSLGFTALHLAAQYQFPRVARALVAAGADTSARTDDGLTAWDIADRQHDTPVLEILEPAMPRAPETIPALADNKRKSSKLRGLLCGLNKH